MPHPRHATRTATAAKPRVDRHHLYVVAGIALFVGLAASLLGGPAKANRTNDAGVNVVSIELPLTSTITDAEPALATAPAAADDNASPTAPSRDAAPANDAHAPKTQIGAAAHWKYMTIKRGDSLSTVFQRAGLKARDVLDITGTGPEGEALKKVFVGEKLGFVIHSGVLQQVKRIKSPLESVVFTRQDNSNFAVKTVQREPEVRLAYKTASIENSLYLASERAHIPQNLTMTMANIFGGVIDFVYDVRRGDQFVVVYEELFLDGEKIDEGNILAAQFVNRGDTYNAYRYTDPEGGIGYYNENGISMRKAFLRAPLDFTRISSGFNLRRLHPVTKSVRPHRGIDYAAPTGTPVFAAGDGRINASSSSKANGKYVFIRHGEAYTTKYLHLSKRAVRNGQRVKQGQIIGYVGCTGLCTGPHLHYEFLVNGTHRNPRTILKKLPKAKSLEKKYKSDFIAAIKPMQLQIASYSATGLNLATRD